MANPAAARTAGRSGLPADLAHGAGARRERCGGSRTGRALRDRMRELYGADLMKDTQDGGSHRANGASGSGSPEAKKTPAPPTNGPRRRWDLSRRSCEKSRRGPASRPTRGPGRSIGRARDRIGENRIYRQAGKAAGTRTATVSACLHFGNFVHYMQYNCCILLEYLIQYKNG